MPESLESTFEQFLARLKMNFPHQIQQAPADFKKGVLRALRRELPPRRGRPNDPRVDAALGMLAQ